MKNAGPERAMPPQADYGTYGADYRFTPVEDTEHGDLRRLYAFWIEARGTRSLPPRDVMSPRALAPWLRHIQTFEIIDGGDDFRCGVCGSGLTELTGLHMTGRRMSECDNPRLRDRMVASLRRAVETRAPVRMIGERAAHAHLAHKRVETIWLPFGDERGPTHILAGVLFTNRAAAA